jgi:hypothetical protein
VFSRKYWEVLLIMIKGRRAPAIRRMTHITLKWKLKTYMIWISCSIIIVHMATLTLIGGVVVVAIMTGSAIISD